MFYIPEVSPIHYKLIGNNFYTSKTTLPITLKHELIDYYQQNNLVTPRYIERLASCGTPINAKEKERCGLIECPLCYIYAVQRQRKNILQRQNKLSRLNLLTSMVTVIFDDVQEQDFLFRYNYLSLQFTKLINSRGFKKIIVGTAKSIETSFSDIGLFHVHLHILLAYQERLNKEELERIIKRAFPDCVNFHINDQESPLNLIAFFDYVTKIPDCEVFEWITYRKLAKKKKRISFTGIIAKAQVKTLRLNKYKHKIH